MNKFFETNKALWNAKIPVHIKSEFYDNESFKQGRNSLHEIELSEVGNVAGKSLLHLQCHFGQDTISWAKLGADVTGIDFSEEAIKNAEQLANGLNIKAKFICSNIYDIKNRINEKFDIVFTSYGTIYWLNDLAKWGEIISYYLKSGGIFYIAEFHPCLMTLDDNFEKLHYDYFRKDEPFQDEIEGTYADKNSKLKMKSFWWNHPLSEIINSLIQNGLEIEFVNEFPYSVYNCFPNMSEKESGKFFINGFENIIPHMFSIRAKKK